MNRSLLAAAGAALTLLAGCNADIKGRAVADSAPPAEIGSEATWRIVGMRRLTEAQYRNTIRDVFGPEIVVAGRFEPIVRPIHELIASGARGSSVSPSGIEQFDAIGRNVAAQVFDPERRAQFVDCEPKDAASSDPACASRVLTPIGRYLMRRPLTPSEQTFYVRIANEAARGTGSFHKGLELSLAAMLVSPSFLYVIETAEPDPAHPGAFRLDNYSRAARLGFLLWNSTPNDALLDAARAGKLTDQVQLDAIAGAMVRSPRFEAGVRAFFGDMLLFEKFDEMSKDPVVYPYFNQDVAQALPEQMLRTIVDHLLVRDGDYRGLFTTNRTFLNRALGPVYGKPVARSQGWVPLEFAPDDDRAGLLGQAGFLALYSHSGRSSPTLRGRAVRELLMCQAVPNPPGNVNFTAVQDTTNKAMPTARIRLDAHNTDPVCAGCHKITDPIGLPLERFDGIGRFRLTENDTVIDVGGELENVKFSGATGLGRFMATSIDTTQCVAGRALEYATGEPSAEKPDLIEGLEKQFAADGYLIRSLFLRVATMPEAYRIAKKQLGSPAQVSMLHR